MSASKTGQIVDDCLNQLLGQCTQINLTAILLNQWEIAVKKSNIQLSPQKVEIALKKLGISVLKITECAEDWIFYQNWRELNLAH